MDTLNFHQHKKGHHLIREERYYISIRLNIDHRSVYKIAKELHSHTIQSNKRYSVERSVCIQERVLCVTAEQPQVITTAH